ncbi:MAG: hypothetical protein NTX63_01715 [Candidatus Peregrinibacteria bacterium]|nr:hypothetical protein [Candidatus Peregrinibacteria bacterium]
MTDIQDVFNQYIAQAELLLNEGKLKDAYNLCMKVLEADPENEGAINMKERISDAALNYNQKAIDEKLKTLKPLWENGEYAELIKILSELYRFAPHYGPLEEQLAQAQDMYRKQFATQTKDVLRVYMQELESLLQEKKYDEMIKLMLEKNREALTNPQLKAIHQNYRDKIIAIKIEEKKSLFETEKFEDIVKFLYQMQQIDRANKQVEELLKKYRKNLLVSQVSNKQEFTLKATEDMTTLYQLGKYEKAVQVAEEILHFDPLDKAAKAMASKAKAKYAKQLQEETENQIATSYQEMKNEQAFNQNAFTSL